MHHGLEFHLSILLQSKVSLTYKSDAVVLKTSVRGCIFLFVFTEWLEVEYVAAN